MIYLLQGFLYYGLTFIVECWRRLVQKQNFRIAYKGSCYGDSLFLSSTELHPSVPY